MTVSFSEDLWAAGRDGYERILRHPFLTGLTDGTLPREAFGFFVTQDRLYLRDYARALALTGVRADRPEDTALFTRHAHEAIAVEQEMHAGLLDELGLTDDQDAEPAPATLAYTSYLLAVCATGSYAEAVAAVLPCYWVYRNVGRELLARSSPDPVYASWIQTYAAPEFDAVVESVIAVTERLGADLGEVARQRCREHYRTTTRYEWLFWDAAYRDAAWPF